MLAPEAAMPSAAQLRKRAELCTAKTTWQESAGNTSRSQESPVFVSEQTQYWASGTEQILSSLSSVFLDQVGRLHMKVQEDVAE